MRGFISKVRVRTAFIVASTLTMALAIAGAGLLSFGAYLVYHPAAFIVGGILLLAAMYDSST